MTGHIERVARGLRASRDRRLNGKDDEIVRELAVEGLQALDNVALEARRVVALKAELAQWKDIAQRKAFALAAARRENATLREALEEAFRWIARLPNPSPATCAYVPEAVYERIGAALAASPAAEEPQP